jgi:hypothetical protein
MTITRKAFLVQLAGGGWVLSGCGGGGGGYGSMVPAPPPGPSGGICGVTIADNHGHSLSLPLTDLDSTVDKTYDIMGAADHTHSVTFTAAQLGMLKAGQTITVLSTTTLAHDHMVSERCV